MSVIKKEKKNIYNEKAYILFADWKLLWVIILAIKGQRLDQCIDIDSTKNKSQ